MREKISQGIYVAGQRLPSERDLTSELHVSRGTVRAALLRLQAENSIDIIPRGGAIVRAPSVKITVGPIYQRRSPAVGLELKRTGSFIRAIEAQGKPTLVRFIEPSSIIPTGDEIGAKMETSPDTQVLRRYRVHMVERVPYCILDSYSGSPSNLVKKAHQQSDLKTLIRTRSNFLMCVHSSAIADSPNLRVIRYSLASLFGDLLGKDEGYISSFEWLKDHTGRRAARAFEKINVRVPTASESALLNISRGQPVVDMDTWVWTDDNTLFEYSHVIANASLHEYTYVYTYDIDEEDDLER